MPCCLKRESTVLFNDRADKYYQVRRGIPFGKLLILCQSYISHSGVISESIMICANMKVVLLVALVQFSAASRSNHGNNVNTFEATYGCLQYSTNHGYEYAHPYYSTAKFENLKVTAWKCYIYADGSARSERWSHSSIPVEYPYDKTEMNELVLSGWANTAYRDSTIHSDGP
nr:uncharacterized protein LOC109428624 [Aedes albopictus]